MEYVAVNREALAAAEAEEGGTDERP